MLPDEPTPPTNVRAVLADGSIVPLELTYTGWDGQCHRWKAVRTPAWQPVQILCDALPVRTSIEVPVDPMAGLREEILRCRWDRRRGAAMSRFDILVGRIRCLMRGHDPTLESCHKPEHDYCIWCWKSMPGMAPRKPGKVTDAT